MMSKWDLMFAAAIEATNAVPLDALEGQRDRFNIAKGVADESGSAVVSVLPIVNGRYHARAGRSSITPIRDLDDGYALGYLWKP